MAANKTDVSHPSSHEMIGKTLANTAVKKEKVVPAAQKTATKKVAPAKEKAVPSKKQSAMEKGKVIPATRKVNKSLAKKAVVAMKTKKQVTLCSESRCMLNCWMLFRTHMLGSGKLYGVNNVFDRMSETMTYKLLDRNANKFVRMYVIIFDPGGLGTFANVKFAKYLVTGRHSKRLYIAYNNMYVFLVIILLPIQIIIMAAVTIKCIKAKQIFDSRSNPIVEADCCLSDGSMARADVPSGASTSMYEALELRDGGSDYIGKGVFKAVSNVNTIIGPALVGKDPTEQSQIDNFMVQELDGTKNEWGWCKLKLGANAILVVSLAVCKAGASVKKLPLYQHITNIAGNKKLVLLVPAFNVINSGSHAGNKLAMQEFMILHTGASSFKEAMKMGVEVYHHLKSVIKKYGQDTTNVVEMPGKGEVIKDFQLRVANKIPHFLKMNPIGKVLLFETSDGAVFDTNALEKYISCLNADNPLYDSYLIKYIQIEQQVDFATVVIDSSITWRFYSRLMCTFSPWLPPVKCFDRLGFFIYDLCGVQKEQNQKVEESDEQTHMQTLKGYEISFGKCSFIVQSTLRNLSFLSP